MNKNKSSCKLFKKTCLSGFYLYLTRENVTNNKLWNITLYLLIDLKTKLSEDWHQVKNIFKISTYVVWLDSKNLSFQKFFCNSIILHAKTACPCGTKVLQFLNSLTPKISLVILLTVCHIVLVMLAWRIWYWIN